MTSLMLVMSLQLSLFVPSGCTSVCSGEGSPDCQASGSESTCLLQRKVTNLEATIPLDEPGLVTIAGVDCSAHKFGWSQEQVPRLLQAFNEWRMSHNYTLADLHAERNYVHPHVDLEERDLGPPVGRALVTKGSVPNGTLMIRSAGGHNPPDDANSFRLDQLQFTSFLNTLKSATQKCDLLLWTYRNLGSPSGKVRFDATELSLLNHASGESASLRTDAAKTSYWANGDLAPGTQLTEDYCEYGEDPSWFDLLKEDAGIENDVDYGCR